MPMIGLPSKQGLSSTIGVLVRHTQAFLEYLELPTRSEYWHALVDAGKNVWMAVQSLKALSVLTFRPLVLLGWLLSQQVFVVLKFLFRHLFQGLYVSSLKGIQQTKWACHQFVVWQYSLTSNQIQMEVGMVTVLVILYLLRRHIQEKEYVQRVSRWYHVKQRRIMKSYRSALDRISRTSLILAMVLPHALFVGVAVTIKVLFPSAITWLARDTYAIFILSQLYPWIWTVALLFQYRHAHGVAHASVEPTTSQTQTTTTTTTTADTTKQPQLRRTPLKEQLASSATTTKSNEKTKKLFPRTAPPRTPKANASIRGQPTPKTPVQRLLAAGRVENYSVEHDASYWLQYWTIQCLVTGIVRVLYLLPIVGRLTMRINLLQSAAVELQLGFYLWIYGMSSILTSTASSDADLQRSYMVRPLPFLTRRVSPVVQKVYHTTSHLISSELWATVVERIKSFLSIAVMMRLLSDHSQTQLLTMLEYAHPFLVPAITLLMPGFITEYGVLYVKTIVPAAKLKVPTTVSLSQTMDALQYWILHALLSGLLSWWSGLLWWIPFSTHAVFIVWCHLQYTSAGYYTILEQELQAFGLLPQGKADVVSVDKTITATMLRSLAKSLPSAVDDSNVGDANCEGLSAVDEDVDVLSNNDSLTSALTLCDKQSSETMVTTTTPIEVKDDDDVVIIAEESRNKDRTESDSLEEKENPLRRSTRRRKARSTID